jgi:hypothetical protein
VSAFTVPGAVPGYGGPGDGLFVTTELAALAYSRARDEVSANPVNVYQKQILRCAFLIITPKSIRDLFKCRQTFGLYMTWKRHYVFIPIAIVILESNKPQICCFIQIKAITP